MDLQEDVAYESERLLEEHEACKRESLEKISCLQMNLVAASDVIQEHKRLGFFTVVVSKLSEPSSRCRVPYIMQRNVKSLAIFAHKSDQIN